ncbi:MAG: peptide/nickel transport system permease protein [Candidatus Binatota bacterium]|jgi:peptide/nickel transport system permease protein|nr:peptide/nickel transport system permease protein [Candidatus Binatota bacterium]
MLAYTAQRLLLMVPTFVGITFIAFLIMHLAPGDPVDLYFAGGLAAGTQGVSAERLADVERAKHDMRVRLGLDQPLPVQYGIWFRRLVTLDLGESFKDKRPVWEKIRERLPVTVTIELISLVLMYAVAIPLGIYSSVRPGSWIDSIATTTVFMLYSLPSFWIATLILIYFCGGDYFRWFPPAGLHSLDYGPGWPFWRSVTDYIWHIAMPVLCTTYASFAALSRFMRSAMLENARQDYVRTARAKGLPERVVILKHVLRNSLIPMVTILAGILPSLIGGSVIIETIFSIPGIGQLGYQAILARDYPVVLGLFAIGSFLTLAGILIADLLLAVVDPRISFERVEA